MLTGALQIPARYHLAFELLLDGLPIARSYKEIRNRGSPGHRARNTVGGNHMTVRVRHTRRSIPVARTSTHKVHGARTEVQGRETTMAEPTSASLGHHTATCISSMGVMCQSRSWVMRRAFAALAAVAMAATCSDVATDITGPSGRRSSPSSARADWCARPAPSSPRP